MNAMKNIIPSYNCLRTQGMHLQESEREKVSYFTMAPATVVVRVQTRSMIFTVCDILLVNCSSSKSVENFFLSKQVNVLYLTYTF